MINYSNGNLDNYFKKYKRNIVGDGYKQIRNRQDKKIIYADWAASGRLYTKIEYELINNFGPYYSNLHSEGNYISNTMELAYIEAKTKIKKHFGADDDHYSLIANGYGMTSAINRLQKIIKYQLDSKQKKPVVFMTQYEHNSNFLTWKRNGFICIFLKNLKNGQVDAEDLKFNIQKYYDGNRILIGAFSACSNVTGIKLKLDPLIKIIKFYNGLVCVDYTTIAPYDVINMKKLEIDALVFSAHKFLGGVGGPGILIISNKIYQLDEPTYVGGGTVKWINPWGKVAYKDSIEEREEAGTPPILQVIKASLSIKLKEEMGIKNIINREKELTQELLSKMEKFKNIILYDEHITNRLPIVSFNFKDISYIEGIKELDENYGIQARGGCSCASIYGHKLLNISKEDSEIIYNNIIFDESHTKANGWIRISLSHVVSDSEIQYICDALERISNRREIIV